MPMLITLAAVGRLKAGPDRELYERFAGRIGAAGRGLGLSFNLREISESRAGTASARKDQEAAAILEAAPAGAILVALDEGGRAMESRAFAAHIGNWRDSGGTNVIFAIGGADGHGSAVLERATLRLAFGAMTWPHQLVRIMLAEQLYRAVTILSGHPYHRD